MALGEFELIQSFFFTLGAQRSDVRLGIGDDCALLTVSQGMQLVVTMDTLVSGVHFLPDVDPAALGHKALAVNLSDLAAMGAEPAWITLGLTLPEVNPQWLTEFSRGMGQLAARHGVQLIGGDTTRGPLSITIQAQGFLPIGQGLLRSGAQSGDLIYVTGVLGDAGLGLRLLQQKLSQGSLQTKLIQHLERPEPRVEAGLALRETATSAIDISDGLLADLGHILQASEVGAEVYLDQIPLSPAVKAAIETEDDWSLPLASGDDYELCFTLPPDCEGKMSEMSASLNLSMTCIGKISPEPGLRCWRDDNILWEPADSGYVHFTADD
ncbi:MAG: thiamine-phosphate kinase [Pseudomonadota bacterium]